LIGGDIRPVVSVMLGRSRPRQHCRPGSQKNPAPHSPSLRLFADREIARMRRRIKPG